MVHSPGNVSRSQSRRNALYEQEDSDLFKEAQDFIKNKMSHIDFDPIKDKLTKLDLDHRGFVQNLSGIAYACGIASKDQCVQQQRQAAEDGYDVMDTGIKLDWRADPVTSMSDWILAVHDGAKQHVYHIHKCVVTFGDRKSGFLAREIGKTLGREKANEEHNVTETVCGKYVTIFIPILLDYIYSNRLHLNSECVVPLRALAIQFDVKPLVRMTSSYIQENLNINTATLYLKQAHFSRDKELSGIAMQEVIGLFDHLPEESLCLVPPELFQQVISNQALDCPSAERLSQRIATYIRGNVDQVDDETFFFLTHCQVVPSICPTEAMWYLHFASTKFENILVDTSMGGYEGTLKYRCMIAASKQWHDVLIGAIKKEVRTREENGDETGTRSTRGKVLFNNECDEDIVNKYYAEIPIDIRTELLELSLIEATEKQKYLRPSSKCNHHTYSV
jgi:hypothetical protein